MEMTNSEKRAAEQERKDAFQAFMESPDVREAEERALHINDDHVTGESARTVGDAEIAEVSARYTHAQDQYEAEAKRIDPDNKMSRADVQDQMPVDIVNRVKDARAELDATAEAAKREREQARLNSEAAALRSTAASDGDYQQQRLQAAMQHRLVADHVILGLGGVLESKIPVWRASDEFRIVLEPASANGDGTLGRANSMAVQPVIYAPEAFHGRNDLFNAAAMCRDMEAGLVRRALAASGGHYSDIAKRTMMTTDTGAWVSKLFWPSWVDALAQWGPFLDDMVVSMVDLDFTDDIDLAVVSSWPDMAWEGEGDTITFSNLGQKKPTLSVEMIAGGTEVTDKQMRNSWFRGLGTLDIIQAKHGAQIGYQANNDISVGPGTGNRLTGVLNKGTGNGQIAAGNANNIIADSVTAAQPTGAEVIDLIAKVDPAYRNVSGETGFAIMANSATVASLRAHETPNRFINTEGEALITGTTAAITERTPDDSAHVAYRLSGIPVIENGRQNGLTAGQNGGLAVGAWKSVHVRRSSHYSAMEQPGSGALFSDKVDARLGSWQYFGVLPAQVDGIGTNAPGPIVIADAR